MAPIRVALVGLGKIARDQHVPAMEGDADFALAATASPHGPGLAGVPHFHSLAALLAAGPAIDAVVLCTPPQSRYELAALALARGLSVFLEKPPGVTVREVAALRAQADRGGVTLFAGWHSRCAPAVEPARDWLAGRRVERVAVTWREDVRVWHPGQPWIWRPGGFGVFDPGINALSILTRILPLDFFVEAARLDFPANRAAPIAAAVTLRDTGGAPIAMDVSFLQTGPQIWDITVTTDEGVLSLAAGGAILSLPSGATRFEAREYPALYRQFAAALRAGVSDVDTRPLQLVADIFLCAGREIVEPFDE